MKVCFASALVLMSFSVSANQNTHLEDFAGIFGKYCYERRDDHSALGVLLERDGYLRNPTFQDAYEIVVGSIDYAVTPQNYDCTADVLVKHNGESLYSHKELSSYLMKEFNLSEVSQTSFEDVAINNRSTRILQTDYSSTSGHILRLLFPLDNQESYYMTFTIDW